MGNALNFCLIFSLTVSFAYGSAPDTFQYGMIPYPQSEPVNPRAPVVILVHGIKPEGDMFHPLASTLFSDGQRPFLFQYDDSKNLEKTADRFVDEVLDLKKRFGISEVRIIAHSMGGLIARRAMVKGRKKSLAHAGVQIKFMSVATPFRGFSSANPAGNRILKLLGRPFGMKASWGNLGTRAELITNPLHLGSNVEHFKMETFEKFREQDSVVTCDGQVQTLVDADAKVIDAIRTGHVEAFRNAENQPSPELLSKLRLYGFMAELMKDLPKAITGGNLKDCCSIDPRTHQTTLVKRCTGFE